MSDTKFLSADRGTVTRVNKAGSPKQGCGHSQHLPVGRIDAWTYHPYLRFALDWTDVGRIVSATLVLYTDDDTFVAGATPHVHVRRLTQDFLNGNNPNDVFDASDYTNPATAAGSHASYAMTTGVNAVNRLDITWLFNDWAPKTVIRSTGVPGTGVANHGISLAAPSVDPKIAWHGWSEEAPDSSLRPVIELEYDPAPTAPATPTNLDPAGSITSLEAFEADFTAGRPGDKLAFSEIEVYAANGTTRTWTSGKVRSTNSETVAGRTHLVPSNLVLHADTTYKWRIRQWNSDGLVSAWTSQTSFSVSNTAPSPPVLSPNCASSLVALSFPGTDGAGLGPDGATLGNVLATLDMITPGFVRVSITSLPPNFYLGVANSTGDHFVPPAVTDDDYIFGEEGSGLGVLAPMAAGTWYVYAWDNNTSGDYDAGLTGSGSGEVVGLGILTALTFPGDSEMVAGVTGNILATIMPTEPVFVGIELTTLPADFYLGVAQSDGEDHYVNPDVAAGTYVFGEGGGSFTGALSKLAADTWLLYAYDNIGNDYNAGLTGSGSYAVIS